MDRKPAHHHRDAKAEPEPEPEMPSVGYLPSEWSRDNWRFAMQLQRRGGWAAKAIVMLILFVVVTGLAFSLRDMWDQYADPAVVFVALVLVGAFVVSGMFVWRRVPSKRFQRTAKREYHEVRRTGRR